MPLTLSADEFAKRYGQSASVTLSADEFAKKYGGNVPRGTSDQPGPVRRFLQGAGVPTSMDEMKNMGDAVNPITQLSRGNLVGLAGPVGLAAQGIMRKVGGEMGTQAWEAADAYLSGDIKGGLKHSLGAAIPIVGPAAAEGNYAGAAGGLTSLLLPSALGKVGRAAQADTLSESIGSQIAAKGGKVFNPQETVTVPKFKTGDIDKQIQALAEKYPNATVYDEGDNLRVEANRPNVPSPDAEATPAAQHGYGIAGALAKHPIATIAGGIVGQMAGHPILGAEVGYLAAEAMSKLVQSPLWKATSGSIKTSVGKAMAAQDFSTVMSVADRVLGGANLEDDYGHDSALHSWVQDAIQQAGGESAPPILNHSLQNYEAVYVSPGGEAVAVPHHVYRQTVNALTSH